jgi:hypothetical protein
MNPSSNIDQYLNTLSRFSIILFSYGIIILVGTIYGYVTTHSLDRDLLNIFWNPFISYPGSLSSIIVNLSTFIWGLLSIENAIISRNTYLLINVLFGLLCIIISILFLLKIKESRIIGLVCSFILLFIFPLGTVIGLILLNFLLNNKALVVFDKIVPGNIEPVHDSQYYWVPNQLLLLFLSTGLIGILLTGFSLLWTLDLLANSVGWILLLPLFFITLIMILGYLLKFEKAFNGLISISMLFLPILILTMPIDYIFRTYTNFLFFAQEAGHFAAPVFISSIIFFFLGILNYQNKHLILKKANSLKF